MYEEGRRTTSANFKIERSYRAIKESDISGDARLLRGRTFSLPKENYRLANKVYGALVGGSLNLSQLGGEVVKEIKPALRLARSTNPPEDLGYALVEAESRGLIKQDELKRKGIF